MEEMPMPEDLVDSIVAALEGDAPAPAPEALDEGPAPAQTAVPAPGNTMPTDDAQGTVRRVIAELSADRELLLELKKALAAVE